MNTTHTAATCRPGITRLQLVLAVSEVQDVDPDFANLASDDTLCEILDEGL